MAETLGFFTPCFAQRDDLPHGELGEAVLADGAMNLSIVPLL